MTNGYGAKTYSEHRKKAIAAALLLTERKCFTMTREERLEDRDGCSRWGWNLHKAPDPHS